MKAGAIFLLSHSKQTPQAIKMEPKSRLFLCALAFICMGCFVWGQENKEDQELNFSATWYSQVGSRMSLTFSNVTGILKGQFHPRGQTGLPITGYVALGSSAGNSSLFGFVVPFTDDDTALYTVAWSGEYKLCHDEHVLYTSWVLKPVTPNCWTPDFSTRTGSECFTQFQQVPEDGKECETNRINPCRRTC